jgi:hypothetical protein
VSYLTILTIRCEDCGVRLPQRDDLQLVAALPTLAQLEQLSRRAIDLGWMETPAILHLRLPPRHHCPKCGYPKDR